MVSTLQAVSFLRFHRESVLPPALPVLEWHCFYCTFLSLHQPVDGTATWGQRKEDRLTGRLDHQYGQALLVDTKNKLRKSTMQVLWKIGGVTKQDNVFHKRAAQNKRIWCLILTYVHYNIRFSEKTSLQASSPVGGVARSHARAAHERTRPSLAQSVSALFTRHN